MNFIRGALCCEVPDQISFLPEVLPPPGPVEHRVHTGVAGVYAGMHAGVYAGVYTGVYTGVYAGVYAGVMQAG